MRHIRSRLAPRGFSLLNVGLVLELSLHKDLTISSSHCNQFWVSGLALSAVALNTGELKGVKDLLLEHATVLALNYGRLLLDILLLLGHNRFDFHAGVYGNRSFHYARSHGFSIDEV